MDVDDGMERKGREGKGGIEREGDVGEGIEVERKGRKWRRRERNEIEGKAMEKGEEWR